MVRIVTDSTSELTREGARKMGVGFIPLTVHFEDRSYLDGVDITADDFYPMLEESRELPTTSQPNPEDFLSHFKEALDAGDEVVAILISSELSGTVQSARIARDDLGGNGIYVVDSLNAAIGVQLVLQETIRYREEHPNATGAEVAAAAERFASRTVLFGVVDTLKYLHKGGRLSTASAVAGSVLGIKPVLRLAEGRIAPLDKVRGFAAANQKVLDLLDDTLRLDGVRCMLGYTKTPDGVAYLAEGLTARGIPYPELVNIGAVIGTHVGPGASVIAVMVPEGIII